MNHIKKKGRGGERERERERKSSKPTLGSTCFYPLSGQHVHWKTFRELLKKLVLKTEAEAKRDKWSKTTIGPAGNLHISVSLHSFFVTI